MGEGNVNIAIEAGAVEEVTPYSMHVSSKYLELTKKKLELTRLPRELELPEQRRWDLGTPKTVLEPLLDYWLERYQWRAEEAHLNTSLPQYRTTINLPSPDNEDQVQSLRIHFVHKRSIHRHAIPLLFCHTWPSSFIEVQKIIDALTKPQSLPSFGDGAQQAFDVVVPSIPGFGFSDASSSETFGLEHTAKVFNKLMKRLGYDRYVAHGTGWGFDICRALALNHPQSCISVHTANPTFAEPTLHQNPVSFVKYQLAKITKASVTSLSFGYVPSEVHGASRPGSADEPLIKGPQRLQEPSGPTFAGLYTYRPQTLAFSFCDSPVGLLAGLLDVIHTQAPPSLEPITSRPRSPFLSPIELEQQNSHHDRSSVETAFRSSIPAQDIEQASNPRETAASSGVYSWSATEVLNWTMMQWLPGPEASLRWLRRAQLDTTPTCPFSTSHCPVPLGISSFRAQSTTHDKATPVMWGSATWNIAWVKRHQRTAALPAWEAPDLLVLDMREYFQSHGGAAFRATSNLPA